MNFIEIINTIFVDKHLYCRVTDEDKILNFFIINRKLGKGFPEIAKKFNSEGIDKASAIDMWAEHFKDVKWIPKWYWDKKKEKKTEAKKKEIDFSRLKIKYEFSDDDISYLKKFFPEDLKNEMTKLNKFEEQ